MTFKSFDAFPANSSTLTKQYHIIVTCGITLKLRGGKVNHAVLAIAAPSYIVLQPSNGRSVYRVRTSLSLCLFCLFAVYSSLISLFRICIYIDICYFIFIYIKIELLHNIKKSINTYFFLIIRYFNNAFCKMFVKYINSQVSVNKTVCFFFKSH